MFGNFLSSHGKSFQEGRGILGLAIYAKVNTFYFTNILATLGRKGARTLYIDIGARATRWKKSKEEASLSPAWK